MMKACLRDNAPFGLQATLLEPGAVSSGALDDVTTYTLPDDPYAAILKGAGPRAGIVTPEQVAAEVVDAAEKPQLPLRIPIGDAARALDYLNDQNVQHRDVKPHNLMLVGDGVKVADFGLAKMMEQSVVPASGSMTRRFPGELISSATAFAFFMENARSSILATPGSVMPCRRGVTAPITPESLTTGTKGIPRRSRAGSNAMQRSTRPGQPSRIITR